MLLVQGILSSLLVGTTLAGPIVVARDGATWTLVNFNRVCDDVANTCRYNFGISKSTDPASTITACSYLIQGTTSSAEYTSYTQAHCDGAPNFSLNQGWDSSNSFITLVVTDTIANVWSFFGYTAQEVAGNGVIVTPNHTSPARTVGQFSKRTGTNPGWSIVNLYRDCGTTNSICNYAFGIDFSDGRGPQPCHVQNVGTASSPASTQSFYAVSCTENPAHVISWGYNAQYGSGVMTVLRQTTQNDAFFGFNDVNLHKSFATVGPNPVYSV